MLDLQILAINPYIYTRRNRGLDLCVDGITIHAVNQIKNPNNKINKEFFMYLKQFVGNLSLEKSLKPFTIFSKSFIA